VHNKGVKARAQTATWSKKRDATLRMKI